MLSISTPVVEPASAGSAAAALTRSGGRRHAGLRRFVLSLAGTTWACLDALIVVSVTLGTHAALLTVSETYGWLAQPWLSSTAFALCITLAGIVFGLYERPTLLSRGRILFRSVMAASLGTVLAFASLSLFLRMPSSRWVGLGVYLTYLLIAVPLRLVAHEIVTRGQVRLLCVGGAAGARSLAGLLRDLHGRHYCVVGYVPASPTPTGTPGLSRAVTAVVPEAGAVADAGVGLPVLGGLSDLAALVSAHNVEEIVVTGDLAGHPALGRIVATCLEQRCRVTDQTTFAEKLLGEVPADSITAEWFLRADVQNHSSYDAAKRIMDLAVALVGLLVSLPLWPLIAVAIWMESGWPLLFTQVRVGQFGRLFTMYKFRTMRHDAEQDGARWAAANDGRVTRVGRILRRSRLDELPQLINILRGDMSLVGPRPERPMFVRRLEQLLPHYRLRHLVKPGLTGWAQIHYGYGASVADAHRKLCYDLYYLKHRSLDLDLAILIRTFGTFLLGGR